MFHSYISIFALSCSHKTRATPIPLIPWPLCLVKPTQILLIRFIFLGNQKPDGKEHLLYHHLSSWCFSPCSCHTWEICQPLGLHQPQGISLHSGHGWKSRPCYVACMRLRNRLVKVVSAARIRLLTWAAWTLTFHWFWHFLVVTKPSQTFSCYKIHSLLERHLRSFKAFQSPTDHGENEHLEASKKAKALNFFFVTQLSHGAKDTQPNDHQ